MNAVSGAGITDTSLQTGETSVGCSTDFLWAVPAFRLLVVLLCAANVPPTDPVKTAPENQPQNSIEKKSNLGGGFKLHKLGVPAP